MKHIKRNIVITSSVLVFLLLSILFLIKWANQPATSGSTTPLYEGKTKGASTTIVDYESDYFSIKLPSIFYSKTINQTPSRPIMGEYLFTGQDSYMSDQLAITVGKLSNSSLDEVSGVKFRRNNQDLYHETMQEAGFPINSIAFNKQDSYEKAVFWQYNNRYVSVVASGGAEHTSELNSALATIISNWQWK